MNYYFTLKEVGIIVIIVALLAIVMISVLLLTGSIEPECLVGYVEYNMTFKNANYAMKGIEKVLKKVVV